MAQKRRQAGVTFPSATKQEHLLIIRFDISPTLQDDKDRKRVRTGLKRLCNLFERIDDGILKVDKLAEDGDIDFVSLSEFKFSFTLGFGIGFFEKMRIDPSNRPRNLREFPDHNTLGDPVPYPLRQTDFMIQLCSNKQDINRWLFQNASFNTPNGELSRKNELRYHHSPDNARVDNCIDIYSIITSWSRITDMHTGFQRFNGRNLLGFNDGISNPKRLSNDVVWIIPHDDNDKFLDGTYMVFQKIEHDIERWKSIPEDKQEQWVGRSKRTGLLLGTLTKDEDRKLALELRSDDPVIRERAKRRWKGFYEMQKDPEIRFYDGNQSKFKDIQIQCPVWSHVRKANPRQANGVAKALIFRRGYLYDEGGLSGKPNSGLLFICFQRNLEKGFEYITKNFLNNKDFPVPSRRNFNDEELRVRHQYGRFTREELEKGFKVYPNYHLGATKVVDDSDSQNTGKDGLSGPSEMGIYPHGQFPATLSLGGGYYFVPPIPGKRISNISEQFFP